MPRPVVVAAGAEEAAVEVGVAALRPMASALVAAGLLQVVVVAVAQVAMVAVARAVRVVAGLVWPRVVAQALLPVVVAGLLLRPFWRRALRGRPSSPPAGTSARRRPSGGACWPGAPTGRPSAASACCPATAK